LAGVDLANPWATYPGGDPGLIPRRRCAQEHTVAAERNRFGVDYDTPNMRVGQYNLSVQRQLGAEWMVSANYIGNATVISGHNR
jgi:hypothetical protein